MRRIIYKPLQGMVHRRRRVERNSSIGVRRRRRGAEVGGEGKDQTLEREAEYEAQNGVASQPLRVARDVLTQPR